MGLACTRVPSQNKDKQGRAPAQLVLLLSDSLSNIQHALVHLAIAVTPWTRDRPVHIGTLYLPVYVITPATNPKQRPPPHVIEYVECWPEALRPQVSLARRDNAPTMATAGRRRSITSSLGRSSREQSLAAPTDKALSKSPSNSALSVNSDGPGDSRDGALDRLRSRNSDDGRSDSSSNNHKRRLSGLFKRKKQRTATKDGGSRDDLSQIDPADSPVSAADIRRPGDVSRNYSDDSLGLHKSVASSLLTEDSDSEPASAR